MRRDRRDDVRDADRDSGGRRKENRPVDEANLCLDPLAETRIWIEEFPDLGIDCSASELIPRCPPEPHRVV